MDNLINISKSDNIQSRKFTINKLINSIKIPDYQRRPIWNNEQCNSFLISLLLKNNLIDRFVLLYNPSNSTKSNIINKFSRKTPKDKASNYYIIDGLQRRYAIHKFVKEGFEILYDNNKIIYNNLLDKTKKLILDIELNFVIIDGNHNDGIKWIDNEQRRISHTAGEYIYRHRIHNNVAKMTYEIVDKTYDILNKYLDKSALYGDYIVHDDRPEDFYPFIANIVAHMSDANISPKHKITCWPNSEGILWLEQDNILNIKYNNTLVNNIINKINNISNKYTIQTLYIHISSPTKSTITTCKAIVQSRKNKGSICGCVCKTPNIHEIYKLPYCGKHNKDTVKFSL